MFDPSDRAEFNYSYRVTGEELLGSSGRVRRARLLTSGIDKTGLYFLQDGTLTHQLFIEAAETFLAGQFISSAIVAFSFIERMIAGRLHHLGMKNVARLRSEVLFQLALKHGWLSLDEHQSLEDLRKFRNPIVHFRDPLDQSRPEIQAILSAKNTNQHLEAQAERVMKAAIHVLNYTAL